MRYLIYPLFGLTVLGSYGAYTATGRSLSAVSVERRSMPPGSRLPTGGFRVAPIFWFGGYAGGK